MWLSRIANGLLVAITVSACARMCSLSHADMTPEQVVEAYLDVALNMEEVEQKEELVTLTTGNLKDAIEAATPETIKAAYIDRQYEIINYGVTERRDRTPRETEITFQLEYKDLGDGSIKPAEAATITTENTVSVVREKGVWVLRDVIGNKSTFDFPVSEASQIRASAPKP